MNKAELIAAISESTELPANDTKIFLNTFIETVADTLGKGGTVNARYNLAPAIIARGIKGVSI
jgi:nucleoid DNA-binding protein